MGSKNTLPEGWRRVKLGEIAEILTGATPLRERMEYWNNGTIPWLTNEEVEEDKINYIRDTKEKITEVALKRTNVKLIPEDSVILSLTASVGKVAINKVKLTTNQQFNAFIVSKQRAFPLFVGYYLLFSKENIKMLAGLTTFDFIGRTTISNFQILLPPLPEQRKIAEILETVDNAIEKTAKIIEKYKRIKQGLMQDLLTKGIDDNGQIRSEETHRFKDSPLGRIPEEWEVVELGCVGDIIYGEGLRQELYEPDGDTLVFGTGGIIGRAKLFLDRGPALVIPRKGSITSVFYIQEDQKFWVIDTAFYLKPKNGYCKFIYFTLCNMNLELLNEATGVPSLSRENIKSIQIPLLPLPEQHRIASILSQIDEAIEKEQKYKEKLERIKQGLMEDLLTGKVRVNELIDGGKNIDKQN